MDNYSNREFEIDLLDLISRLWAKKWIIIVCGIALAFTVGFFSKFFLTAKYESSTKLYVSSWQDGNSVTYNDLQTATQLTADIQEIIISQPVIDQVISDLKLDIDEDALLDMISVTIPEDTRIVVITAEWSDPHLAREIADQVREVAVQQIEEVMGLATLKVVETANLPTEPSSPNIILNCVIGGASGLLLSAIVLIVIRLMDSTIKTQEDVERYIGANVIACIPLDKQKQRRKRKQSRSVSQRRYYAED